jgi:hypothetical protein
MRRLRALIVLAALAVCAAASAAGPVYVVNSSADVVDAAIDGVCETVLGNGICTLRAAVMEANLGPNPGAEEVTIQIPADNYILTSSVGTPDDHRNGDLNLTGKVRLLGAGVPPVLPVIDGNHVDRVFFVHAEAVVTLENLQIQGGKPPLLQNRSAKGGGIHNVGSLTLRRSLVRANETIGGIAGDGGGIYSGGGSLTIVESMIRVHHPAGGAWGGAIRAVNTTTSISYSSLYSNSAGSGGAILQSSGTLTIWNSTISGNAARESGGGVVLIAATGVLNNVTIVGNVADNDGNGSGGGGGMAFSSGSAVLSNSVLNNYKRAGANYSSDDFECPTGPSVTSNGSNIFLQPAACATGAFTLGASGFGEIAANGGTTVTHIPSPNSGPVNAGKESGCLDPFGALLTKDQRGVKRPIGARCDLGAVELEPIGDANGDGLVTVLDVFYLINFLFAGGPAPLGRGNVNGGDGSITVLDVFYLINYLFAGGPPPA